MDAALETAIPAHNGLNQAVPVQGYEFRASVFIVDEVDFTHTAFGLTLRSNRLLPVLPLLETPSPIFDIELHLGVSPLTGSGKLPESQPLVNKSSYKDESGKPIWEMRADGHSSLLHLTYYDGMQFWLDRKGKCLWAVWPPEAALEDAASYLLGPVLGILLRLRGVTCLHASAVALEDRSVAFVGPAGAGKSTTAAAFAKQGYAVISDDIVALDEREGLFQVMPAYPHLCLWPDSVQMLYGSQQALPRIIQDWDKRRLAAGDQGTRFEGRPLPLAAIYILGESGPHPAPRVEGIRPQAAFLSLVAGTYANNILDREMRRREFAFLGRLIAKVPVRQVRPSDDPARLEDLCRIIHQDFALL